MSSHRWRLRDLGPILMLVPILLPMLVLTLVLNFVPKLVLTLVVTLVPMLIQPSAAQPVAFSTVAAPDVRQHAGNPGVAGIGGARGLPGAHLAQGRADRPASNQRQSEQKQSEQKQPEEKQSEQRQAGPAVSDQAIAPAEAMLFQTNHLRNLQAPATLVYKLHHAASGADASDAAFDDRVRLHLDASRTATLEFMSGARQWRSPGVEEAEGNPVLLGFLERDIAEMQRLTGGSMNYFRKRIRLALAHAAQVRPLRIAFGGKSVAGREVAIEPYRDDPMHARFERYTGKRYLFVLSEQVPGGIFQLRALVPAAAGARKGVMADETLTLTDIEKGRH